MRRSENLLSIYVERFIRLSTSYAFMTEDKPGLDTFTERIRDEDLQRYRCRTGSNNVDEILTLGSWEGRYLQGDKLS